MALLALWSAAALPKSEQVSTYYRFKVDLDYDGKPFPFNVVIGCGVRVTDYSFNGSTIENRAVSAVSFALATPDGHAIAVETLPASKYHFCHGDTTASGRVPADYTPLVVWFERADELGQGLAYRTPAAYASPNARLRFRGASVERATREEFEDFQANGVRNLFPPYQVDWLMGRGAPPIRQNGAIPQALLEHPRKAWPYLYARSCSGVARVRLTEAQRAQIRPYWPSNRPRFWQPAKYDDWDRLRHILANSQLFQDQSFSAQTFSSGDADVFPARYSEAIGQLDANTFADDHFYYDVTIGDGRSGRGFMWCDIFPGLELEIAVTKRPIEPSYDNENRVCRIDGRVLKTWSIPTVSYSQGIDLTERVQVERKPTTNIDCARTTFYATFENDEFVIYPLPDIRF